MDPSAAYQKMIEAGMDWADKNAAAQLLEDTRKSVRADVISRLSGDMSGAQAERLAEGSEEYRTHIQHMVEARRQANRARVEYDARRVFIDMWRSTNATQRAEAQLAGVQK